VVSNDQVRQSLRDDHRVLTFWEVDQLRAGVGAGQFVPLDDVSTVLGRIERRATILTRVRIGSEVLKVSLRN